MKPRMSDQFEGDRHKTEDCEDNLNAAAANLLRRERLNPPGCGGIPANAIE